MNNIDIAQSENRFLTNPFHILGVSCSDNRKAIVAAAEEKAFLVEDERCSIAQNVLINPAKRLMAELDWFVDASETTINSIKDRINNHLEISTDGLVSLSLLNAVIYNFEIDATCDMYEIGYAILDIDNAFASVDKKRVNTAINESRALAGLPGVSPQEIENGLNLKRNAIKRLIDRKITSLHKNDLVEMATLIAEKCIAEQGYNDGVVLSDVIDLYEVQLTAEIEADTADIERKIERIKKASATAITSDDIGKLVQMVASWDKKVQPLQLKSQASGMPHQISEDMGFALRSLAIHLHNGKGRSEDALMLIEAMKPIFAEIGILSTTFTEDRETLGGIIANNEAMAQIDLKIDSIEESITDIKSIPTKGKIDALVSEVKTLDETVRASSLSNDKMQETREGICAMIHSLAIELHNNKKETAYALRLVEALVDVFGDVSEIKDKLEEDIIALRKQLRIKEENEKQKEKSKTTSIVALGMLIILALVFLIDSGVKHMTNQDIPAVSYSSSVEAGTKVYADIKSIFPAIGIYREGSSDYYAFVCECKTSSGKTVWVSMSTTDYKNFFDSTASTSVNAEYAEEIIFSSAKRVHGITKKADSVMYGLSSSINATTVISFSSLG